MMGNLLGLEEYQNNNQRQDDLQRNMRMAWSYDECLEDITDQWTRHELRNIVNDYKGNIKSYKKVHNHYLESVYNLKKDEYISKYGAAQVRELALIHSTSAANVPGIFKDNFNWRRVVRTKYGKGVSFSEDADYANYHSNRSNGSARAFIIAKVLVSNMCRGYQSLRMLPDSYDTSYGPHVYVKYRDNEFLPQYVLYYDMSSLSNSKYHNHFIRQQTNSHFKKTNYNLF